MLVYITPPEAVWALRPRGKPLPCSPELRERLKSLDLWVPTRLIHTTSGWRPLPRRGRRGGRRLRQQPVTSLESYRRRPETDIGSHTTMNIPVIVSDICFRKQRCNEHRLSVLQPVKLHTPEDTDSSLLRCYVINARSLRKNNAVQLLDTELRAVDGDVAAITETWLSKKVNSAHINIPGYNFFRQDRQRRKGGGVGAYVRRQRLCVHLIQTQEYEMIMK